MEAPSCDEAKLITIPLRRYNELVNCEKRLKELRIEIRKSCSVVWSEGGLNGISTYK